MWDLNIDKWIIIETKLKNYPVIYIIQWCTKKKLKSTKVVLLTYLLFLI